MYHPFYLAISSYTPLCNVLRLGTQSSLPIPPFFGLEKNWQYSETAVLGGSITLKTLNGQRYWEGGGIGREAVLGGTTVLAIMYTSETYLDIL